MTRILAILFTLTAVVCLTPAIQADEVLSFGDVVLAGGEQSSSLDATVSRDVLGFDVAFNYPGSFDGSWSSDYIAIITDPSGDTVRLGTGLGSGDLSYELGTPTGIDGRQLDDEIAGSFGTYFDVADIQGIFPTFAEAGEYGTYSAVFFDGWQDGSGSETLGSATITIVTAVPEPAGVVLLSTLGGLAMLRRRRR